jgi:TPR repeat protein
MNNCDTPNMVKALEKFDKEEYQEAFVLLVPLSEAGNPRAQRCLADMYHLGLGVERDGVKAAELYLRVGEKNIMQDGLSAVAYNNLATLCDPIFWRWSRNRERS